MSSTARLARAGQRTDAWPHALRDSRGWCYLTVRPGTDPFKISGGVVSADVAARSHQHAVGGAARGMGDRPERGQARIRELLDATERRYEELRQPSPKSFFLYIDQGEEIYVRTEEAERRRYSATLSEAIGDERLRMLMSLRSDFLGALQGDEPLFAVHRKIDVPPLRHAELLEIVCRPAQLLSARFETIGLSADIARRPAEESVQEAGALPLLSYLLDDMWTEMVERGDGTLRLPSAALELGGVLAQRADAFVARIHRRRDPAESVCLQAGTDPRRRRADAPARLSLGILRCGMAHRDRACGQSLPPSEHRHA